MTVDAAPQPGRWWTIANGVRVDDRDRERLAQLIYEAVIEERDRCCQLVFGHASSDNVAQRTVDAIRGKTKRR